MDTVVICCVLIALKYSRGSFPLSIQFMMSRVFFYIIYLSSLRCMVVVAAIVVLGRGASTMNITQCLLVSLFPSMKIFLCGCFI